MKKGHGTRAGGYFRQIAMPLSSPLPVLRPVRRWPVHPGEERIQSEKISISGTAESSRSMIQKLRQLGQVGPMGGPQERASNETIRTEAPRPSASPEIGTSILAARADSQKQNQRPIYKDTVENPARALSASSSASRASTIAPETLSSKSEQVAEKKRGTVSSQVVDASARRSRSETVRVSESSSNPIYEATAADEAGKQHLEFPLGDETRPAFSHRIGERQDKIEIGSIEVRIVNPTPSLSAVAPPAAPRLRPMAGGAASSSGSLARGLRGPWGLRQG